MKNLIIGLICTAFVFSSMAIDGARAAGQKVASKGELTVKKAPPRKMEINWLRYNEGLELAKKEGKKIFVEFTAKWCGYCRKMHATTFRDPAVIATLDDKFISVSVDGDSRDTLNIDGWVTTERNLTREYRVTGYPTYWFLGSDGEKIAPMSGYKTKEALLDVLDYLKDDVYKTVKFKDFIAQRKKGK